MAVHHGTRRGYPLLDPPPPRPKGPSWEKRKFTIGTIWLGHFWCTTFWDPDPTPPASHTSPGAGLESVLRWNEAIFHQDASDIVLFLHRWLW